MRAWRLISRQSKGADGDIFNILSLQLNGLPFCEYAEGSLGTWHVYYSTFPLKELVTREACIRDAEIIAGHALKVENE